MVEKKAGIIFVYFFANIIFFSCVAFKKAGLNTVQRHMLKNSSYVKIQIISILFVRIFPGLSSYCDI